MKKKLEVVMTSVSVGRLKLGMDITSDLLGIKVTDPIIQNFMEEHIKFGKVNFMPNLIEKELKSIEQRVRMNHRRRAIKNNWGESKLNFMTIEMAKKFESEILESCKREYFELLDEIVKKYPTIRKDFLQSFELFMATNSKKSKFVDEMQSIIPVEEDYEKTFYMSFNTKKMDITDDQEVINSFLAKAIQIIFDEAVTLEKSFNRGKKIATKTLSSIKNIEEKVNEINIVESKEITGLFDYFDKIIRYKGKGTYVVNAIDDLKKDCKTIANDLEIFDLVEF